MELPFSRQDILDTFIKTGKVPSELNSYEAQGGDLYPYKHWFETPSLRTLLDSARQAKLKIVAVDVARNGNLDPDEFVFEPRRDMFMAQKVEGLVKNNAASKVVFWGGADHSSERRTNWWHSTMAQILSQDGVKVASAAPVVQLPKEVGEMSLAKYAAKAVKPIAVPTDMAKTLGQLPRFLDVKSEKKLKSWDAVLIVPNKK